MHTSQMKRACGRTTVAEKTILFYCWGQVFVLEVVTLIVRSVQLTSVPQWGKVCCISVLVLCRNRGLTVPGLAWTVGTSLWLRKASTEKVLGKYLPCHIGGAKEPGMMRFPTK